MTRVPRPPDAVIAELLQRLVEISDFNEACSTVLDLALEGRRDRVVVVLDAGQERRSAGWGVSDDVIRALLDARDGAGSLADAVLERVEPTLLRDLMGVLPGDFAPVAVLPFLPPDRPARGAVLVEADRLDERGLYVQAVFQRCGAALVRCLERETLGQRIASLERRNELLGGIVDALADPVLLTDHANGILLTNRRADDLFSTEPGDSDGRRHAVQVNNLFLSTFLTQAVIGADSASGRELNLVDPSDGSDLLFEPLSTTVPHGDRDGGTVVTVLRDITDLKLAVTELESQINRSRTAEHRARRERDQLNVVLENVGDPILVTDTRAKIILMNGEAERLFEGPSGESANDARPAVRANDTKVTGLISNFLLQSERRQVVALELAEPETGAVLPVEVVSSKIFDARGEATAIVSVLHDRRQVVENQRLARELQRLNEGLEARIAEATAALGAHNRQLEWQSRELEKASRMKSEFLANMSHELRTPLNVLIGYTSLLTEGLYGELSEAQAEALEKVRGSASHLLRLINDILDLSRIEAGKMPVHLEEVDVSALVAEVAESLEPLTDDRSLDFSVQVADGVPRLRTDRTKVRQILFNLVSNAIKFTESGWVRVSVEPAAAERGRPDGCAGVALTVADSGVGIRADDLAAIFEDFHQLDQSTTKRHGGTGLGLSITRKLVALLGGGIEVESRVGVGSTFRVHLPLRPAARAGQARHPVEARTDSA